MNDKPRYIDLINSFWNFFEFFRNSEGKSLSITSGFLYLFLIQRWNRLQWQDPPLVISAKQLCAGLGISEKTFRAARMELQIANLVNFETLPGKKTAALYWINLPNLNESNTGKFTDLKIISSVKSPDQDNISSVEITELNKFSQGEFTHLGEQKDSFRAGESPDLKKSKTRERLLIVSSVKSPDQKTQASNPYQTDLTRIEKLLARFLGEREWLEMVMMKNPGVNWQNVEIYIERFIKHISGDMVRDSEKCVSFSDKKTHFRNWLPLHLASVDNQPSRLPNSTAKKEIGDFI